MIAVLSGDLVNSTQLSSTLYQQAIQLLEQQCLAWQQQFPLHYQLFRGDAFQLVLEDPHQVMRCAMQIRLALQAKAPLTEQVGVTLSVGLGDYQLMGDSPATSQGEAFELSGRGLDKATSGSLQLHTRHPHLQQTLVLNTAFVDHLLSGLTASQAQVLLCYMQMDFAEHHLIAERLNSSRQNVSQHLQRAAAPLIKRYLEFFEQQVQGV